MKQHPNRPNGHLQNLLACLAQCPKKLLLCAALLAGASATTQAQMLSYYIGVDGQETIPSGTYAGLPNPNYNRVTFLYAHTYSATPGSNHYHSKSRLVYTGPNLGAQTEVINLASNFVPEGARPPLLLAAGSGLYDGKFVSTPYSDPLDTNYPFSFLEIGAVDSLDGFAVGTGEHYLFNSSGGRWTTLVEGSHVHLELVSITSGLNIGTASSLTIGLTNPGDEIHLWDEEDELADFSFTPVFWTDATASPGVYTASFRLTDDSGMFGESGVFEYRFEVIPEPSTAGMILLVAVGLGLLVRTRAARRVAATVLVATAGFGLGLTQSQAQPIILDDGHMDLDFNYSGGQWHVQVHHEDEGDLAPADAVLHARDEAWPAGSRINRPADSQWDFIGVGANEPFYLFPQNQQAGILWPGFASEGTAPGTFAAYSETDSRVPSTAARWITIHLKDVTYYGEGTGHFSLWSTGAFGTPTVWMSTAEGGITADDKFLFLEGGHTHVNWGFSDIGYYEITLEATAFLNDGFMTATSSGDWTFNFGIGTTVIPEPGTALLVGAGLTGLLLYRRERERHALS